MTSPSRGPKCHPANQLSIFLLWEHQLKRDPELLLPIALHQISFEIKKYTFLKFCSHPVLTFKFSIQVFQSHSWYDNKIWMKYKYVSKALIDPGTTSKPFSKMWFLTKLELWHWKKNYANSIVSHSKLEQCYLLSIQHYIQGANNRN